MDIYSRAIMGVVMLLVFPKLVGAQSSESRLTLTVETIMRDPIWIGGLPSGIRWSDDSKWIYFDWNPDALDGDSLYRISRDGGTPQRVSAEDKSTMPSRRGDFNHDRSEKVYSRDGDFFLLSIETMEVQQITNTLERESNPQFTHAEDAISFERDDNIYLWSLGTGTITQITDFRDGKVRSKDKEPKLENEKWVKRQELTLIQTLQRRKDKREASKEQREQFEPERPLEVYMGSKSVSKQELSPDMRFVTFVLEDDVESKSPKVPRYVTETGYTDMLSGHGKSGSPQSTYTLGIIDRDRDTVYYLETDEIPGIYDVPAYRDEYPEEKNDSEKNKKDEKPKAREIRYSGLEWSPDGTRAVIDLRAMDHKDRWIMLIDLESAELKLVDRQHDDAWIAGPGIGWSSRGSLGWLADNQTVWFQSEATGYSHIYTIDVNSGKRRQRTRGDYEVSRLHHSHNKKSWYFHSNQAHPGERRFYRLDVDGDQPIEITSVTGNSRVYLSPDETQLAIRYSYSNRPWELYVQENRPDAQAKRVTHSLSDEFKSYPWRDPELLTFEARDGANVYARLYRPPNPEANGPAVIFVHGAGYLQNAHKWWSGYYREYMFHNFLADQGYTVLDIDFRASAGYGRDWRTAIYRHMGGKDLTDQVDGAKFLVDNYDVDSARIGIYGGSYGGFITLMAMFTEPGIFAAGAGLRSVTDWAHYNHWYTSNILNVPQLDSIAYTRSSPIYFAEGLEGALLLCHGVNDVNVQFSDVVRLSQRLIELGKDNWEIAFYPVEGHSFKEPSSWTDEYKRVFNLFEKYLK